MPPNDPDPKWQLEIHNKIVNGDPTAFAELCECAIDELTNFLIHMRISSDEFLCQTVIHDLLLSYMKNPQQYNPNKLTLFKYLRMAAKWDLKNEVKKEERKTTENIIKFEYPNVEESLGSRNNIQEATQLAEWVEEETGITIEQLLDEFRSQFDEIELEFIELMIVEGVRDTTKFAEVLRISDEPKDLKEREVKKFKDKIKKKIKRFGERKRRGE